MIDSYWIAYHLNRAYWGGEWRQAGELAASALNCPRETVSELERLYRDREIDTLSAKLMELDFISATTGDISAEAAVEAVDDLVCFRVYIRHFLSRYCSRQGESDALNAFLHSLDGLAAQLRSEENPRRTVLSTEMTPEMGCRPVGGQVCECLAFGSLRELLLFDVMRALEAGLAPRTCENCGRYFAPPRPGVVRCGGNAEECRDAGAEKAPVDETSVEIQRLYSTACGRLYTRKSRGTLSSADADRMLAQCAALRDRAAAGELDTAALDAELFAVTGGRRRSPNKTAK